MCQTLVCGTLHSYQLSDTEVISHYIVHCLAAVSRNSSSA